MMPTALKCEVGRLFISSRETNRKFLAALDQCVVILGTTDESLYVCYEVE
jgi:hypothetical protein